MAEKWLAYGRYGNGTDIYFTIQLESEPVSGRAAVSVRDATPQEIAKEKERRDAKQKVLDDRRKFEARQDYQDAQAIRDILEWMEPDNHPLDRLTPAEWAELRRRLTA